MSLVSGGAVRSNRPRTDLARASAEQLAGATLPGIYKVSPHIESLWPLVSGFGCQVSASPLTCRIETEDCNWRKQGSWWWCSPLTPET